MTAFFDGFFSVFRVPFSVPDEPLSMDWDGDGFCVRPAGKVLMPSDIPLYWKKVGNYLRTSMTDYEHLQQERN
jgi:hypothetical protein